MSDSFKKAIKNVVDLGIDRMTESLAHDINVVVHKGRKIKYLLEFIDNYEKTKWNMIGQNHEKVSSDFKKGGTAAFDLLRKALIDAALKEKE